MGNVIKQFSDGSFLERDKGNFDYWCIYLTRPGITRYAPEDWQYFQRLQIMGEKYGMEQIYSDFVEIYDVTKKTFEREILDKIADLSQKYGDDSIEIEIDLTIIYAGMLAEENKAYTRLGKRIKRLGVHQLLVDGWGYNEAANYSRDKKWRQIDEECKKRGF